METKEINIVAPVGYTIDKENSTFDCIKFKKIGQKRWRDNKESMVSGYCISPDSSILLIKEISNTEFNQNVFATEKQAKSALAMARISQIMANDERFGGVVTDEEWNDRTCKYSIYRSSDEILIGFALSNHCFLAFHTRKQCNLFLAENEDLVKDYLMID